MNVRLLRIIVCLFQFLIFSQQPKGELAENDIILVVCEREKHTKGLRNFRGLSVLEFVMNLEIWICCFSLSN